MSGRFAGKVVVITGASMGVGAAAARAFAREGAKLVLVARGREALDSIATELSRITDVMAEPLDVSDAAACATLLERATARFGRIDVLVNNAGLHIRGSFDRISIDDIEQMIEVNLTAPLRLIRLALPHLERTGGGAIVNVASLSGVAPLPGASTYTGTKFGLRGFSYSLAEEVRDRNITVSLVSPGPIDTGFLMDHLDAAEDLAFSQPISSAAQVAGAVLEAAAGPGGEIKLPLTSGVLATIAYLFPSLARRLRPALRRKGAAAKARLRRARRE